MSQLELLDLIERILKLNYWCDEAEERVPHERMGLVIDWLISLKDYFNSNDLTWLTPSVSPTPNGEVYLSWRSKSKDHTLSLMFKESKVVVLENIKTIPYTPKRSERTELSYDSLTPPALNNLISFFKFVGSLD